MNRRSSHWKLAFITTIVLILLSCSDSTEEPPWGFDDEADSQWESLDGPPRLDHDYLGQIDNRHYFATGYRLDDTQIISVYEPGEDWSVDEVLGEILAEKTSRLFSGLQDFIVAVDGAHYVFNHITDELYRSTDHGHSWQSRGPLPDEHDYSTHYIGSDGDSLVFATRPPSNLMWTAWLTEDGGDSWEELGSNRELKLVATFSEVILLADSDDQISLDGGNSWQEIDESCTELPDAYAWFEFNGDPYWYDGDELTRFLPDGCETIEVEGYGTDPDLGADTPAAYEEVGDRLLGVNQNEVAILEDDLSTWTPLPAPPGRSIYAYPEQRLPFLFDLGDAGFALRTPSGFWKTDDEGENWTAIGAPSSNPRWVTEFDNQLLSHSHLSRSDEIIHYRRHLDESQWELEQMGITGFDFFPPTISHLVVLNDVIFGRSHVRPAIYRLDYDEAKLEQLWPQEPLTGASGSSRIPAANVEVTDDLVIVSSAAGNHDTVLPGSGPIFNPNSPDVVGGIYVAESLDDPDFQFFGEGFPTDVDDIPIGVHDMAIDGARIWVVTDREGVWTAEFDVGEWTQYHEGLPTADSATEGDEIRGIEGLDGELYAYSVDAVYTNDADTWQKLTVDSFRVERALSPPWPEGISDLVYYNDALLAAAHDGLYEIDIETGQRRLAWQYDNRPITFAEVLPSGLYVGVENGGLWRYDLE